MAQPTAENIEWYAGVNGVPTNDTDPTIGAIDTGAALVPDEDGQLIGAGEADVIGGSPRVHYGGGYVRLNEGAGGSVENAYLSIANGGLAVPTQGELVITDPTGANAGLELVVVGVVGGEPFTEELTLSASAISSSVLFDAGSDWWIQTKDLAAIAGVDGVDDLIIAVDGTQVALMRAPNAALYPNGCRVVGSIYRLAVTTAADEEVSGINRLTLPTADSGLSEFKSGAKVSGNDDRLPLGTLEDQSYRGFVIQRTIPAGFPVPSGGASHILEVSGLAVA